MHVYFSLILWKWKNKSEKKIISIVNRSFVINKFLSLTVNLSQYAGMHWFILGKKKFVLIILNKKNKYFPSFLFHRSNTGNSLYYTRSFSRVSFIYKTPD